MGTGILSHVTKKLVPHWLQWEEEEVHHIQAWEQAYAIAAQLCQPGGATGKPASSFHPINTHLLNSRCVPPSQPPVPGNHVPSTVT